MNILLISQCRKNALTETRRILDQFAERRGERTWQTPITQAGLDTLRRLLRKTARKNTAVACHWIRGKDHSELLWIVGDAAQFNAEGSTPTNATRQDVLRRQDENDWHSLPVIRALATLAALLHDLGKASVAFQERLRSNSLPTRNLYRHEWVSLRLFQGFVGDDARDEEWLNRLLGPSGADEAQWLQHLRRDGLDALADRHLPLNRMPPLARAIGWLILSHHRLPVLPNGERGARLGSKLRDFHPAQLNDVLDKIGPAWNELSGVSDSKEIEPYWFFEPHGLPVVSTVWHKQASRVAKNLLSLMNLPDQRDWLDDPYIMHLARLVLMQADHYYSSLSDPSARLFKNPDYPLYANTTRTKDQHSSALNQTLDEHLLGVARHSSLIAHALPGFERQLPHLARHKGLRKRSSDPRFQWQDRAVDIASAIQQRATRQGAFIVNMASTGSGKTLANARIMNALADRNRGLRCAFAMGLRTLTLQTGQAFQRLLGLSDDELAIQVGGATNREMFEYYERQAERSGSASSQALLAEDGHVFFEGNDDHPLLHRLGNDPQARALLAAPLLVCTVDHLMPATESLRGGRQIAPMLRLMSGDLVLDEPDDFDIDDLPALTRLVHWAGLLGSRVLLSSATLPPALVDGLYQAYLDGRRWFQRNRGERHDVRPNICCAWFDEFSQYQLDCADADAFISAHDAFARKRSARLSTEPIRRRSELLPMSFTTQDQAERRRQFAEKIRAAALRLHEHHHSEDPRSGKRVSFGLVRMANIAPLFDVALALYRQGAPEGTHIHLCVYHSQFPLLLRSAIEYRLDSALDRRNPSTVFDLPEIRHAIDARPEANHLFIVLGSPVTEVGRDHDYDWAVVEPSSMRSLIQLAGRVRRHRVGPVEQANLLVFETNLRHFEHPGKAAFCKPGFERDEPDFKLTTHSLDKLLDAQEYRVIDARPRMVVRGDLQPTKRLVDLEHARLIRQMSLQPEAGAKPLSDRELRSGKKPSIVFNACTHWRAPNVWLTGILPQQQPFRYDPIPDVDLVLLPNDDEDDDVLHEIAPGKRKWETLYVPVDGKRHRLSDDVLCGARMSPWGEASYLPALQRLAEDKGMSLRRCAERFGTVTLPDAAQGWRFHPLLGFTRAP